MAGIAESEAQSAQWAELRQRWMGLVMRRAGEHGLDTRWLDEPPPDLGSDADEAAAIIAHWEAPIPAFYCNRDIQRDDYPVPADMRDS